MERQADSENISAKGRIGEGRRRESRSWTCSDGMDGYQLNAHPDLLS